MYELLKIKSALFAFFLFTTAPKDCLSRLGQNTLLVSAIGADSLSEAVLNYCKHIVSAG